MKLGGTLGYRILRALNSGEAWSGSSETRLSYVPKIKRIVGEDGWNRLRAKTILDFGCGVGAGSIEMARHGATRVIGLDIRPDVLDVARQDAEASGVSGQTTFTAHNDQPVDVIVSIDAFEHFADPAGVLAAMDALLDGDGYVVVSFGPPWYHPRGGHLFSLLFPWSHLVFTEHALLRWRRDFKSDGAARFTDVAGGLNMMTISRFIRIVEQSAFEFGVFNAVPIRRLTWAQNRFTREFTSAVVECTLVKKAGSTSNARLQPTGR